MSCVPFLPSGPLRQFDLYGIDIAVRTGTLLAAAYPDRVVLHDLPAALYSMGRLGCKTGAGFFSYGARSIHGRQGTSEPGDAYAGTLDPEVRRLIGEHARGRRSFLPGELTLRLFLPMLLEAARVLEERIVDDAAAIDEALAGGLGFLPIEGGLLRWADAVGLDRILESLKPFTSLGRRYEPPPQLIELARTRRGFYDYSGNSSAAAPQGTRAA